MITPNGPAIGSHLATGDGRGVDAHLAAAAGAADAWHLPAQAIIVPHGDAPGAAAVAATAYAALRGLAGRVGRVVLIGPAHHRRLTGLGVPAGRTLATPLGAMPLDRATLDALLALPGTAALDDEACAGEPAIAAQLPFLQRVLGPVALVPLLAGEAGPDLVAEALALAAGDGPGTLVVISSDLSHGLDDGSARRLDTLTSGLIETLRGDALESAMARGYRAIGGMLARGRTLDLRTTALDLRTSADFDGRRERVVGFGAFALEDAASACLPEPLRARLQEAVHAALDATVRTGRPPPVTPEDWPRPLRACRQTFVTLELDGELRGCIGSSVPVNPLVVDVVENAHKAATCDPRFPPLTADELPRVEATISILSTPRAMPCASETELLGLVEPGRDGLILADGPRHGLFLPKVWDLVPDPRLFLAHLKVKAGLPVQHWSDRTTVWRFSAETF